MQSSWKIRRPCPPKTFLCHDLPEPHLLGDCQSTSFHNLLPKLLVVWKPQHFVSGSYVQARKRLRNILTPCARHLPKHAQTSPVQTHSKAAGNARWRRVACTGSCNWSQWAFLPFLHSFDLGSRPIEGKASREHLEASLVAHTTSQF